PALAGLVSDTIGWRWVFLGIVAPVLVMGFAVAPQLARFGPVERRDRPARRDMRRALDSIRLAAGSTMVPGSLTVGSVPIAIALLVGGGWLAIGALGHLLPAGSLRLAPGRPSVVVAVFAVAFAFFGTEAFVPLTVVEIRGGTVTLG